MDSQQFESLNPQEQAKIFHHSSFKERAELIRHSHDPRALTRSLSHEELYLLTREMDIEDRSEIIRYATLPQLTFIADVDCWKKDRIDSDNFLEWMETLLAAGDSVLLNWLLQMDYETVVAGFQKICEVLKPEREYAADEILGDTPYFTIDDVYYIAVREENLATVRRGIQLLFENNKGRYYSLLEDIIADISDQVEEDAYQNREHRLASRGFPDDESARKIYRPITQEEFESFPPKKSNSVKDPAQAPRYPVLASTERLFLDDVLLHISKERTEVLEGLHDELAWISNKLIACDGIDFSSEEKVRKGIQRARYMVSLGLELLSNGDVKKALRILEEKWCEIIFRWGMTGLLQLRERVNKLVRDDWKGDKLRLLDFLKPPYDQTAQGLLRQVPQCYDAAGNNAVPLRDFKSWQDVERSAKSLEQIEKAHQVLRAKFPEVWKIENVSSHAVFGTLFAVFCLKGKLSLSPLAQDEVPVFTAKALEKKGGHARVKPELKEQFLTKLCGEADSGALSVFLSFVFDDIEDELGSLDFSKTVDSRFISCLLTKTKSAKPSKKMARKS